MAEWLYEAGIGEARAALVDDGVIIEALVDVDDGALRVGAVFLAQLIEKQGGGRRGLVRSVDGKHEAILEPLLKAMEMGRAYPVEVVRAAIAEPGHIKRAKVQWVADATPRDGPSLADRLAATRIPVTMLSAHGPDRLEGAGWSEALEDAARGAVRFDGGALRISLTPAMTLIDVDGDLPPLALALAGAGAAGAAIRRFGVAGSIGIDLPTVGGKTERTAIGSALDAHLPHPFERTAVNGFGFVQIIRPRLRASLCEMFQFDAPGAAARALLRRAERSGLMGAVTLVMPPMLDGVFAAHPAWCDALSRQLGGAVSLRIDPSLGMASRYVTATIA